MKQPQGVFGCKKIIPETGSEVKNLLELDSSLPKTTAWPDYRS